MAGTPQRLIDGAIETIRRRGIAGVSARTVAACAGVNQGLIFYHFGSMAELLKQACVATTGARVALFEDRLAAVGSLRELLAVGRELHGEERALGNVDVVGQLLAGAQADPELAAVTAAALALWIDPIERTLDRLVATSPVRAVLDVPGLARAICAAFVGLSLYEGADPDGAAAALDALDRMAVLVEVVDDLGPVARRALRGRLRGAG